MIMAVRKSVSAAGGFVVFSRTRLKCKSQHSSRARPAEPQFHHMPDAKALGSVTGKEVISPAFAAFQNKLNGRIESMMTESVRAERDAMVEKQVRTWDVLDERVLDLLRRVPREAFVPAEHRYLAYADVEVPLPHAQHMLSPKMVGRLLQALELAGSERVLEIGTGSGFVTACLAGSAAQVRSLEYFGDLAERARANLAALAVRNAEVVTADANGLDGAMQFDAIALTASVPRYPEHFQRLLRPGGRAFFVVGEAPVMEAMLVRCVTENAYARETLFETVLDPLINARKPPEFTF